MLTGHKIHVLVLIEADDDRKSGPIYSKSYYLVFTRAEVRLSDTSFWADPLSTTAPLRHQAAALFSFVFEGKGSENRYI